MKAAEVWNCWFSAGLMCKASTCIPGEVWLVDKGRYGFLDPRDYGHVVGTGVGPKLLQNIRPRVLCMPGSAGGAGPLTVVCNGNMAHPHATSAGESFCFE